MLDPYPGPAVSASLLAQLHVLHGASLWAFALLLYVVPKERRLLPATSDLGLLVAFGALLGATNFVYAWRISASTTESAVALPALATLVCALMLLLEYGRRGIVQRLRARGRSASLLGPWGLYPALLAICFLMAVLSADPVRAFEAVARGLIGLPGAVLAAIVFARRAPSAVPGETHARAPTALARAAAGALFLLGACAALFGPRVPDAPSWLPSEEAFYAVTGIPIQAVRAAGAIAAATLLAFVIRCHTENTLRGHHENGLALEAEVRRRTAELTRQNGDLALVRFALDSSQSAIAIADLNGALTYVNAAFVELWGLSEPVQALGRSALELWREPEEAAKVVATLKQQGQWQGRLVGRRPDRSTFSVRVSAHVVTDPNQRPLALMASFVDLTRLDEVTAQVQREQAFSHSIVAAAPVMVVVLAPDGRVRDVNPYFERTTGFLRSEVIGRDWIETLVPERERPAVGRVFARSRAGVCTRGNVIAILNRAGGEREVEWFDQAVRDVDGRVIAVVAIGQDVTERRRQQALRDEERRRLRKVIDGIAGIVVLATADGEVLEVNEAVLAAMGRQRADLIGRRIWDAPCWAFSAESQGALRALVRNAADGATVSRTLRAHFAGEQFPMLEVTLSPVRDGTGRVTQVVGFAIDVTERLRAEHALIQAKEFGDALLRLSREFELARTPVVLVQALRTELERLVGYRNAWIAQLEPDPRYLRLVAVDGPSIARAMTMSDIARLDTQLDAHARRLATAMAPVVIDDMRVDPVTDKERVAATGIRTSVTLPLFVGGRRVGALGTGTFGDEGVRPPSAAQLDFLTLAGAHIAVALERIAHLHRLEKTERRLTQAQAIAKLGSWELDLRTNRLHWSDEIFRIFEIDPQRFGASYEAFLSLVHPDDRARLDTVYRESVAMRKPYFFRHRLLMADGRVKWVEERGETTYGEDATPIVTAGTVQDITDHVRLQEQRRATEDRYTRLYESMADAYVRIDDDGRIVETNLAFQRLLGYDGDALRSMHYESITAPDSIEHERQVIAREVRERGFSDVYEKGYVRRDGSIVPVESRMFLLRGADGMPEQMWALVRDVSQRRAAQRQLEAAIVQKELLLKEVYHRVKNNLQVVTSLLNLQARSVTDIHTRRLLQDSADRVQSMALVHEQLYRSPDLARIDLAHYLERLGTYLMSVHRPTSLRVPVRIRAEGGITLDLERTVPCGLIVNELVSNAYKHAYAVGANEGQIVVEVRARADDEKLTLAVINDGREPPSDFDPARATSLGLRLVATLAAQLDGELRWRREGPHTRFEVVLPIAGRPSTRPEIPPPAAVGIRGDEGGGS
jgi:PAS domain S-box-containing protein